MKIAKNSIVAVCAIGVFVLICMTASHAVMRKTSEERMSRFLSTTNNTDILFIGTSQAANDISPMELWEHYGYTSFVLSAPSDGILREWAMLRIALEYTSPKLVVLNADKYWEQDSIEKQLSYYHLFSDHFPLSKQKVLTTLELFPSTSDRMRILFPFVEYHDRWKELGAEDFNPNKQLSVLRGAIFETVIEQPVRYDAIPEDEKEVPEGDGQEVISRIIEECQARGIDICLLTLPRDADATQQRYFNSLDDLAEKYGIEHINLQNRTDLFNTQTDFVDDTHMNVSGAKKITAFLGEHIKEHYDVPYRFRTPEYMEEWGNDYREYSAFKQESLRLTEELYPFLLQCRDDTIDLAIYVAPGSSCYEDETSLNLIRNIIPFREFDAAAEGQHGYYALTDYNNGLLSEEVDPDQNCFDTEGGNDIYIAVFDRWSGEHICTKAFDVP